jgi:hypothetical protein
MKLLGPKVHDAIHLCGQLRILYLCIVQDDEEDFNTQIQLMDDVYANSYVAIVVAGAIVAFPGNRWRVAQASRGCLSRMHADFRASRQTAYHMQFMISGMRFAGIIASEMRLGQPEAGHSKSMSCLADY